MASRDVSFELRRPAAIAVLAITAVCAFGTTARADSGPVDGCAQGSESASFWKRLRDSYQKHLFPGDAPAAAPDPSAPFDAEAAGYRKDLPPPPVSNPPWPYAVWNEGGTQLIGYENLYSSALMDAIYCGSNGKAWKDSRFVIYGWIEPGGNISTSNLSVQQIIGDRRQLSGRLFLSARHDPARPGGSILRAHAGRDPARSLRLGFPLRRHLWDGLQVHLLERHFELSVHARRSASTVSTR